MEENNKKKERICTPYKICGAKTLMQSNERENSNASILKFWT